MVGNYLSELRKHTRATVAQERKIYSHGLKQTRYKSKSRVSLGLFRLLPKNCDVRVDPVTVMECALLRTIPDLQFILRKFDLSLIGGFLLDVRI